MTHRSRATALAGAVLCFAAAMALPLRAAADADNTPFINLVALASQRLALAAPVARWKWAHHRPITDAPREAALLAGVERRAQAAGVDGQFAHAFFRDQISASKEIQNALFEQWRTSGAPPGPAPDLATSTRPALDRLTPELIAGLARVAPLRDAADCPTRLADSVRAWKAMTRYDAAQRHALSTALAHVCTNGGMSRLG